MTVILSTKEMAVVFMRRIPGYKHLPYCSPKRIYDQRVKLLLGSGALTSVKSDGWWRAVPPHMRGPSHQQRPQERAFCVCFVSLATLAVGEEQFQCFHGLLPLSQCWGELGGGTAGASVQWGAVGVSTWGLGRDPLHRLVLTQHSWVWAQEMEVARGARAEPD